MKGVSPTGVAIRLDEDPIHIVAGVAVTETVGGSLVIPVNVKLEAVSPFAESVFAPALAFPYLTQGLVPVQLPIAISVSAPAISVLA